MIGDEALGVRKRDQGHGRPAAMASHHKDSGLRSTFGAQLISIGLMFYLNPFILTTGPILIR